MRRLILALIFLLAGAINAQAQSTTVSGNVTDTGAQAWIGGSYQFQFTPNPKFPTGPYTWSGGTLNQVISGTLDASGNYSVSIPSNTAISPQGSTWILQVTPNATSPSASTPKTIITGGTQTLNVTPGAIATPATQFARAYADGEIAGATQGSQYFNVTSLNVRVCTAVTALVCSTWANVGSGGGGGTPGGANTDIQFNNSGSFGGVANLTFATGTNSLTKTGGVTSFDSITGGPTNSNGLTIDGSASGTVALFGTETGSTVSIGADSGILMLSTSGGVQFGAVSKATPIVMVGSTSGTFQVSTSPTASQLNFGSNANVTSAGALTVTSCTGCGGGSSSFSSLTSGTNTTAAMVVGTGASLSSVPQFNIGAVGTSGILGLLGTTSGTATLTAPAVAGTSTNAVVSSNNLSAPALVSTVSTGTAPLTVASTTNVANLNASSLNGATFAAPGAIGGTTPAAGTFTTLTANTSLTINGGTAQTGTQGTDTKLLTAGTVSGTGVNLCTDASGGATTTGCTTGGSGTVTNIATTSPITGGPITTTGTIACATCVTSAASLTSNQLMTGAGGQASQTLGSLGTTTTVLHGNASGAPSFGAVALTTDVSGTLPIGNGGTGQTTANAAFNALSPMTTLGDVIFENSTPAGARLAAPTTPNSVPQFLTSTPSGGVGAAPVWNFTGVPTNAQTGTSYTFAATDRASYVSFSNAAAIAVTLPQAGSTNFASNFVVVTCDIGAGTATITPTTSTISFSTGSAYTSGASTLALSTGQCAWIYSDNTNYFAIVRSSGSGIADPGNNGVLYRTALNTTRADSPGVQWFSTGGGTAQAQTATLPTAPTLTAGLIVRWSPAASNTAAAPTLAVNGLTATAITKCGTTALVANDIVASSIATAVYDGTQFELMNPQATGCEAQHIGQANTNAASTPSGTQFLPFIGTLALNGTQGIVQATMPRGGTVSNLNVRLTAAEGAAATLAFTLEDGSTAESVTCTVGNSASTCSDTTHSFTWASGDLLSWRTVQTGTGTSQGIFVTFTYY